LSASFSVLGFAAETWFGIVAPAGTPHAILAKLNPPAPRPEPLPPPKPPGERSMALTRKRRR